MKIISTTIPDVLIIEPTVFGDARGFFYESYNTRQFQSLTGVTPQFVQDNHSRSARGVLRGLHYQIRQPQGKLVRVTAGEVFDVCVDLRRSSPFFGQSVAVTLSAENHRQLWIPPGFAHVHVVTKGKDEPPGPGGLTRGSRLAVVVSYDLVAAVSGTVFGVVIAVARKTRSGEISSYGGLFGYAPGLASLMTIFMASLAGIPPLGGWFGKFTAFQALISAGTGWSYALAVVGAVNSVVAFGYYGSILREMWMKPAPHGDTAPVVVPSAISVALAITGLSTLVLGVLPGLVIHFGDLAGLTGAFGK
jgi:dTDP-4-dehydrorhamnose 3,5-epimerase